MLLLEWLLVSFGDDVCDGASDDDVYDVFFSMFSGDELLEWL